MTLIIHILFRHLLLRPVKTSTRDQNGFSAVIQQKAGDLDDAAYY
ncbi:MAG TPA: hypothetical protein VMZ03_12740 [Chitinophagaceae bacterium]|nr:hypothetical protein [Chitinophagaceae bacterium]